MEIKPIRQQADIDANLVRVPGQSVELWIPSDVASIAALVDITPTHHRQPRSHIENDMGPAWYGNADYTEAVELYRIGWPEGLERAMRIIRSLSVMRQGQQERKRYRPAMAPIGGFIPNVSDLASNGPSPFIASRRSDEKRSGRKIYRILYNAGCNAGVLPETMMARGACTLALVEMMERSGRAVSVDVCKSVRDCKWSSEGKHDLCIWRVKTAGTDINRGQLAFAMAHPAAYRRILFASYELLPHTHQSSQGSTVLVKTNAPHVAARYDLVIDSDSVDYSNVGRWTDPARAELWIKEQLALQGIACR